MTQYANQPTRQTVMQYSLRAIFLATLAVAVLCAIIAPFLRNSAAFRDAFLRTLAMASAGATFSVAWNCWRRYRLEQRCGPLLMIVSKHDRKHHFWSLGLNFVGAFAMLAGGVYQNTVPNSSRVGVPPPPRPVSSIVNPFMAGTMLANLFLILWWKGATVSTEFCENGVIVCGAQWIPWSEFRGYRKAFDGTLQLLKRHEFISIRVPPELQTEVANLLDAHIPATDNSQSFNA